MKRYLKRLLAIFMMSFAFVVTAQAAETYQLDPYHNYVQWRISHLDFSHPSFWKN